MVQEYRSSAGSDGDTNMRWKSVNWQGYVNRSLAELVMKKFTEMGEKFGDVMPEFVKTSAELQLAGGTVAKPADAFVFFELMKSDGTAFFYRITSDRVLKVKTGADALLTPSEDEPVYWEEGVNLYVLPAEANAWKVVGRYVVTPTELTVVTGAGGTDLSLNRMWHEELLQMVVAKALADADNNALQENAA